MTGNCSLSRCKVFLSVLFRATLFYLKISMCQMPVNLWSFWSMGCSFRDSFKLPKTADPGTSWIKPALGGGVLILNHTVFYKSNLIPSLNPHLLRCAFWVS